MPLDLDAAFAAAPLADPLLSAEPYYDPQSRVYRWLSGEPPLGVPSDVIAAIDALSRGLPFQTAEGAWAALATVVMCRERGLMPKSRG